MSVRAFSETRTEQTDDGAFRRQPNRFTTRFGQRPCQAPVEPGRYRLIVSTGCGWSRRQLIVRRLLGLEEAISVGYVTHRDDDGWVFGEGLDPVLEVPRLNDVYRREGEAFAGRGTVPVVVDTRTGRVVTNDYHTLSVELETVWRPHHAAGAPDLYPADLAPAIDLLNQQLFDDVNNGPYKILFASSLRAARAAKLVYEARLDDLDARLETRRYLFGPRLTDSDVRLFVTLLAYDAIYRPAVPAELGPSASITDFPHLWAYARDLFATPGFADDREKRSAGLLALADGGYARGVFERVPDLAEDPLAPWLQPHGREGLAGSPETSGPGGAGTGALWHWSITSTRP